MILQTEDREKIEEAIKDLPTKLVLSNPLDKTYKYKKTVIQKILLAGKACYQIERFTDKQVFHENIEKSYLEEVIFGLFPETYSQLNIFGVGKQWDFKVTKKGKLLSNTHVTNETWNGKKESAGEGNRLITVEGGALPSHNRKKNYILKEGTVIPPLIDLGIFTKDGKVVRSMYDKYKQVNRFLEIVDDVVKEYDKPCWHIIDFGCGKSYLTFILYYYLVKLKGLKVQMIGLDLKADVIANCNATAEKYGYDNLHFELGDINGYQTDTSVDMVITLHACDTATDYALYNAIKWNADVILSVPCCQHELNAQMKPENLTAFNKYGIVKERMAALMTDTIRGCRLEYSGYKTQLLEFIDIVHSPKNILIRAVKSNVSEGKRQQAMEQVKVLCEEFHFEPTLLELVKSEDNEI